MGKAAAEGLMGLQHGRFNILKSKNLISGTKPE